MGDSKLLQVGGCEVFHEEIEVTDHLAGLGLSATELREALLAGEAARMSCTKHDAPGAGGYLSYTRTGRALREIKVPQGWVAKNPNNVMITGSPDGAMAILVATGNAGTGRPTEIPKTKYPKGPATQKFVENNGQLWLLADVPESADSSAAHAKEVALPENTWILLRRRSSGVLLSELSLPLDVDSDKRVCRWARRIILPPLNFNDPIEDHAFHDDRDEKEVDVPVERL